MKNNLLPTNSNNNIVLKKFGEEQSCAQNCHCPVFDCSQHVHCKGIKHWLVGRTACDDREGILLHPEFHNVIIMCVCAGQVLVVGKGYLIISDRANYR